MPYMSEAEIHRIGNGLIDRSLPKAEWTHAGHFAAALWLMRYRPDIEPARDMPGLIRAYNEAVGGVNSDTAGYHETITQASLRAACAELNRHPPDKPIHEVVNDLMASPLGNPQWLRVYWSKERLMSVAARRSWINPDLQPFPF